MTLTARSRRASLTGATLAVAAVLTAGCSPSDSSSSSSVSAGASASGSAAVTSGNASASGSAGAAAAACATTALKASTGGAGGGAAGSFYSVIDFTNTSTASCTLYGYPGVSLTTASGAQIGAAATRDTASAPRLVTLAPGATANAELRLREFRDQDAANRRRDRRIQLTTDGPAPGGRTASGGGTASGHF